MGKHIPKSKSNKEDEMDEYDNDIDELYRPYLIHSTTYALLTEQILSLMPSDRNVLLTMNEYNLSEINPMHPDSGDSPTHIIIFCIRFIAGDLFQPIGGLLTYKYKDQSVILAECLKAYINDLWKLGLHVVGTVSPPFESFKAMLSHLVDVKDFNTYANSLVYSVAPIKEIVHIYDIQFLLIKLQNLFKEGDIKFMENTREYRASWNDISLVLNLSSEFKILSNYLSDNKDISRRVHIFTQQIFEQLLELEAQGILSENAGGSAVLLNCIRSFLQFTELDLVDLNLMCKVDGWNNFTNILPTMIFQKSKKRTCTKIKPTAIHVLNNPSIRRKIDFHMEDNSENIKQLAEDMDDILLLDDLEENLDDDCEILNNFKKDQADGKIINKKYSKKNAAKNNRQKREKVKTAKDAVVNEEFDSNCSKIKLHSKKPYDKQKSEKTTSKKANTSVANEKTDLETTKNNVQENSVVEKKSIENKLPGKTEDFLENISGKYSNQEQNKKTNLNCDVDKNNNTDESLQYDDIFKNKNKTSEVKCDNKTRVKNSKKTKNIELKEENFDVVINDAQKFFESFFVGYNNTSTNTFGSLNIEEMLSNNPQSVAKNVSADDFIHTKGVSSDVNSINSNDERDVESYNDFCSQTDEETENFVTKICDKVPIIVESLSNEEYKETSDEFEHNDVTCEMLCTVFGMKKLMENLIHRRVKIAKPDAFVVEHIDFLVTIIKRDKNKINPVYYYGHNYDFLNAELAFSTLQNNIGLFLVKT